MKRPLMIDESAARYAIEHGEFSHEVIHSNRVVIIAMTQDWCPQWLSMSAWLPTLLSENDLDIYELVYNRERYLEEFLAFKEGAWRNHTVPYVRYYRSGEIVGESNFVGRRRLKKIAGILT